MKFCIGCGQKLDEKAKFCSECGKKVIFGQNINFEEEADGYNYKCPSCGDTIKPFQVVCPSCGQELRKKNSKSVVKELELELKQIEECRSTKPMSTVQQLLVYPLYMNNGVDRRMADRIMNFSVPNTVEDIYEFMILAVSNIDSAAYYGGSGYMPNEQQGKMIVSNAWKAKYEQVYQKAKLMFPTDKRLEQIELAYQNKQNEIKKGKRKSTRIVLFCLFLLFGIMLFSLGIIYNYNSRVEKKKNS